MHRIYFWPINNSCCPRPETERQSPWSQLSAACECRLIICLRDNHCQLLVRVDWASVSVITTVSCLWGSTERQLPWSPLSAACEGRLSVSLRDHNCQLLVRVYWATVSCVWRSTEQLSAACDGRLSDSRWQSSAACEGRLSNCQQRMRVD